jgi:hypothetical protein
MAAPRIIDRILDDPGAHWIQVDIAQQLQKVTFYVHQNGSVAALEEMTRCRPLTLHVTREPAAYPQHRRPQRDLLHLHDEMDVICHPAERVHAHAKAIDHLCNNVRQPGPIGRSVKDGLPVVAPKNDVVETTFDVQARRPWHRLPSQMSRYSARPPFK